MGLRDQSTCLHMIKMCLRGANHTDPKSTPSDWIIHQIGQAIRTQNRIDFYLLQVIYHQ